MALTRLEWGELQVSVLRAGSFWLDGGSMFGVVPKPLWEKEHTPDERNRICLALNLLLIDDGHRRTLVDTGAGTKLDAKTMEIYRLETRPIDEILAPACLLPDDIDLVINTHLHFDHAGGNTVIGTGGEPQAALPDAEYVVQRQELEMARLDNERTRAAYFPADFEPLASEKGRLREVEGPLDLGRGLSLRLAPGHTAGMQVVLVEGARSTLAFLTDLVPTAAHVRLPWIMAFDLDPLASLASKKRMLAEALAGDWRLVFQHDPVTTLGVLEETDDRLRARPWRPEE
jgi:glyoxylase-like metal-dependent hydrolase (beta-lactamase superfamily II)